MILYLGTSALAKMFISETGSEAVASAVGAALTVATHRIAYLEMHATLGRAVCMNRIPSSSLDEVDLTDSMARRAAELAIRCGLTRDRQRSPGRRPGVHDALAGSVPVTLGASDLRLTQAATLAGLSLQPLPRTT